jgi:TRAP-type transport system periplasmic protein
MKRWADLTAKESGGRIRIRIFPQASMASGKQDTELEMVQKGGIDASFESSILLSGIEPAFSVWSLPWLFDGYAAADSMLLGHPGTAMLTLLEAKGLVGLGYGHNGFRQLTNSVRPVRRPSDLRGMKVRVPAISMYLDVFRELGADPSPMNFGEVFVALQQGTIDGQENPLPVIQSARLAEVQKHLSIWNYSYDPIVLCVNRSKWDDFTLADQSLLRNTAREALAWQRTMVEQSEKEILSVLRSQGMQAVELTADDVSAFRAAVSNIDAKYASGIGAERIRVFRSGTFR